MNDLRLILLGIGVLIIAGIYLWEIIKQKRDIRSRIENYPAFNHNNIANIRITPKIKQVEDFSDTFTDINSFLKQPGGTNTEDEEIKPRQSDQLSAQKDIITEQIIVLYITAFPQQLFSGPNILLAMEYADFQFGAMNIFHYYRNDQSQSKRALFSLANMLEPGYFDLQKMEAFTTTGLALFLSLPVELEGAAAFDMLLGTAQTLADLLSGEVRDAAHKLLNPDSIKKMRETASLY